MVRNPRCATATAADRLVAAQMVVAVGMVEIISNSANDDTGGARGLVDRCSWAYTTVAWHTAAVRGEADFVSATGVQRALCRIRHLVAARAPNVAERQRFIGQATCAASCLIDLRFLAPCSAFNSSRMQSFGDLGQTESKL